MSTLPSPPVELRVDSTLDDLTGSELTRLLERRPEGEVELAAEVRTLLDEVRSAGDDALLRMARDFDGVDLPAIEVPRSRWETAPNTLDPGLGNALERAARNLDAFHGAQIPRDLVVETEPGVTLGRRSAPLPVVGVYAPGGRAAYPSSVLMGVVPARAAGVPEIVVCSPPGPDGFPPLEVMAACAIGGATRLFALGGAGAIGAMAFGTRTVPRVEAIVGPGNRWVTEAKRQVAGGLRIDSPAGPSEVLVIAGPESNPDRIAAELLAQAEHDPEASVAVVAWDAGVLRGVRRSLARMIAGAEREEIVRTALSKRGALLLAGSRAEALDFSERYAAEHLALFTDDPRRDLETQTTAGTVFLGEASSVAFGDYLTGANHVLPTGGRSRAFSGLSVLEFLRFYTWQELSAPAAARMAGDTALLADAEGLPAHAAAARMRAVDAVPGTPGRTGEGSP